MVFKKRNPDASKCRKQTLMEKEQAMQWQTVARSINDVDTSREESSDG